jgi:hypothetical protein
MCSKAIFVPTLKIVRKYESTFVNNWDGSTEVPSYTYGLPYSSFVFRISISVCEVIPERYGTNVKAVVEARSADKFIIPKFIPPSRVSYFVINNAWHTLNDVRSTLSEASFTES